MTRGTPTRDRITCETCGLPFYADRGACPYCTSTTEGPAFEADDTGFVFDNAATSAASTPSGSGDTDADAEGSTATSRGGEVGLLGRLRRLFRG